MPHLITKMKKMHTSLYTQAKVVHIKSQSYLNSHCMAVLDPRSVGFHRGRAALPATSCGRGRHRKEVNASLYRQPQP